jgi:hypothetical protein
MTVADVINNVKCDLYMAISETPNSAWVKGYTASFEVSLQVKRETGGNGDLTLVVPYFHPAPGLFTIVVGGGLDKSGEARMSFNFDAEENLNVFMSRNRCDYAPQLRSRHNLAGETGLRLWFGNVIDGINEARIVKQTTGFSYNLEFITTVDGHIRPSFTHTYQSGRIFSGAFDANHSREDKNTLQVSFAPYAPSVPFAATDLGKALAGIEAQLREARKKESAAEDELAEARVELALEKRRLKDLPESQQAEQLERLEILEGSTEEKLEKFQDARTTVRSLEKDRANLGASAAAAAAAAAAAGAPISTRQQLNYLRTLDAIRNIPR